jgi:plasmid stability protein
LNTTSEKKIPTLICLDPGQREVLKATARANERSMAAEVRYAITKHLNGADAEPASQAA